ncbi:MAG: glycosyltransferase family 4 protein [Dehalococcoidales bacterium]|nr:MAG: glycosyltransferase family 4 protein [Dehalococcoidales bacterium]
MSSTDSAGTDGVSLQMMERRNLLEEMGHQAAMCSAYSWADYPVATLEFDSEEVNGMMRNLYGAEISDYEDETELAKSFDISYLKLKRELETVINSYEPDLILAHNMMSLPVHPVATVAFTELLIETGVPCSTVHHDILSEGAYKFRPTCDFAQTILDNYYPPSLPRLRHWTINTRYQRVLLERGIETGIMHDTMNYNTAFSPEEHAETRSTLRTKYDIGQNDIVLFVAARIVPNKQTELTGHLAAAVQNLHGELKGNKLYHGGLFSDENKILLVLGGRPERAFSEYKNKLFRLFDSLKLNWVYLGDEVSPKWTDDGVYHPLYPDLYYLADISLYPSVWEGFGSLVLKTFASNLPLVVFEYPVFKEDIAPKGVKVISLGDSTQGKDSDGLVTISPEILERAANEVVTILTDSELYRSTTVQKFKIGQQYFSLDALREHLRELIEWADSISV